MSKSIFAVVFVTFLAQVLSGVESKPQDGYQAGFPIPSGYICPNENRRFGDQFVMMTKYEEYDIVKCISRRGNRLEQKEFDDCVAKGPAQTTAAFDMCSSRIIGPNQNYYDAVAAYPPIILEVSECTRENTVEYTPDEAAQEIAYEVCTRDLYANTCGKFYPYQF